MTYTFYSASVYGNLKTNASFLILSSQLKVFRAARNKLNFLSSANTISAPPLQDCTPANISITVHVISKIITLALFYHNFAWETSPTMILIFFKLKEFFFFKFVQNQPSDHIFAVLFVFFLYVWSKLKTSLTSWLEDHSWKGLLLIDLLNSK